MEFAFLRAINVGGHVVKMDRLRSLFEELGFARVETFIASGNVVFDGGRARPAALEQRIEAHLAGALGYEVATFIRSLPELAALAQQTARAESGGTLYVGFLRAAPPAAVAKKVMALSTATDELRVTGREVYWRLHTRMNESAISGALLEKALGRQATFRNINTIRRLVARYGTVA